MNAVDAAEASGRATDLRRELDALFREQNQSADEDRTVIPVTYLPVTVRS